MGASDDYVIGGVLENDPMYSSTLYLVEKNGTSLVDNMTPEEMEEFRCTVPRDVSVSCIDETDHIWYQTCESLPAEHRHSICEMEDGYINVGFCSGVAIKSGFALSAAHCVDEFVDFSPGDFAVGFGSTLSANRVPVVDFRIPEHGVTDNWENDIAVLALAHDFPESKPVLADPMFEWQEDEAAQGQERCNYRAVGYGLTESLSMEGLFRYSKEPRSAQLCEEANYDIQKELGTRHLVQFSSYNQSGQICFGDSGGPIFIEGSNQVVAITSLITSYSPLLCSTEYIASYTPIAPYKDFIAAAIEELEGEL